MQRVFAVDDDVLDCADTFLPLIENVTAAELTRPSAFRDHLDIDEEILRWRRGRRPELRADEGCDDQKQCRNEAAEKVRLEMTPVAPKFLTSMA